MNDANDRRRAAWRTSRILGWISLALAACSIGCLTLVLAASPPGHACRPWVFAALAAMVAVACWDVSMIRKARRWERFCGRRRVSVVLPGAEDAPEPDGEGPR